MKKILILLIAIALMSTSAFALSFDNNLDTAFINDNAVLRGSQDVTLVNDLSNTCTDDGSLGTILRFYAQDNMPGMDILIDGNQLVARNRDGDFKGTGSFVLTCQDQTGLFIQQTVPVDVRDKLTIISITGQDPVTQEDTQLFEIAVENHLGEAVEDVTSTVWINSENVGFCSTNHLGECRVAYNVPRDLVGQVTAKVTAEKDGFFINDLSGAAEFVFTVFALNPNNQPPVWSEIGTVDVDGGVRINLDNYASDLEDSTLTYSFGDGSTVVEDAANPLFGSKIVDNILTLFSQVIGEVVDVFVKATDGDGASATTSFQANLIGNQIPDFSFGISADVTEGNAPLTVTFTAVDVYGFGVVSYEWDFDNDGTIDDTGRIVTHTFDDADDYTVKAYGTDAKGRQASAQIGIEVFGETSLDDRPRVAPRDVVHISNVGIPNQGVIDPSTATLSFAISVANDGSQELDNMHIRASVPDLGLRGRSVKFDLNPGEETHERVRIETTGDIEPGYYLVHFSISNDDYYREVNREIWVN